MSEFIAGLGKGNIFWLLVIGGGVIYGVVYCIVQSWRRVRITEIEATLKQQMLDRGMTAEDIERIMRASSRRAESASEAVTEDDNRSELIQNLAENGMSAEDIERILRALQKPTEVPAA